MSRRAACSLVALVIAVAAAVASEAIAVADLREEAVRPRRALEILLLALAPLWCVLLCAVNRR